MLAPAPFRYRQVPLRAPRGVAIITAVMVAGLVALIASGIAFRQNLWLRQTENQLDMVQARNVASAGVNLTRLIVYDIRSDYTAATDPWTLEIPGLPVEQGEVSGQLHDQQGHFNLNGLVTGQQIARVNLDLYRRLLNQLNLDAQLADALVVWMGAPTSHPNIPDDKDYLELTPPRRMARQPLLTIDELRLVSGYTPEIIRTLAPFVTALPKPGAINVNFAEPELLVAMVPGLDIGQARLLAQQAKTTPFKSQAAFRNALPDRLRQAASVYDVTSSYYLADMQARFGRVRMRYQALIEQTRGSRDIPTVVWQRRVA